jgi:hypothetical protein
VVFTGVERPVTCAAVTVPVSVGAAENTTLPVPVAPPMVVPEIEPVWFPVTVVAVTVPPVNVALPLLFVICPYAVSGHARPRQTENVSSERRRETIMGKRASTRVNYPATHSRVVVVRHFSFMPAQEGNHLAAKKTRFRLSRE